MRPGVLLQGTGQNVLTNKGNEDVCVDPLPGKRSTSDYLHLWCPSSARGSRCITSEGFQFLLKDNYRQLWTFLTEYIKDAEKRSSELCWDQSLSGVFPWMGDLL